MSLRLKITEIRDCSFAFFCYLCSRNEKKAHGCAFVCEKSSKFALSSLLTGVKRQNLLQEAQMAYLHVDEHRQLI